MRIIIVVGLLRVNKQLNYPTRTLLTFKYLFSYVFFSASRRVLKDQTRFVYVYRVWCPGRPETKTSKTGTTFNNVYKHVSSFLFFENWFFISFIVLPDRIHLISGTQSIRRSFLPLPNLWKICTDIALHSPTIWNFLPLFNVTAHDGHKSTIKLPQTHWNNVHIDCAQTCMNILYVQNILYNVQRNNTPISV